MVNYSFSFNEFVTIVIVCCQVEYYRAVLPENPNTSDLLTNLKSFFSDLFFDRKEKDKEKDAAANNNNEQSSIPANTSFVNLTEN